MPRSVRSIALAACALVTLIGNISAQDVPAVRDTSLLTGLGLPEIALVADDTTVGTAPTSLDSGWYNVSLENQTADTEIEVFIVMEPEGITLDEFLTDVNAEDTGPPSWLYDVAIAGGPNSYGGQTDSAVVNLTDGTWWFLYDRYTEPGVWTADVVTVAGETAPLLDVPGGVPVSLHEYTFELPETMTAGEQIWQLANTGEQPHFFVLAKLPDGTTQDEFMAFLMSLEEGDSGEGSPVAEASPEAGGLSEENISFIYDSSFISGGATMFVQVGLEEGTYALLCWFPDRESGAPHVAMGMVNVFTVDQ